MEPVTESEQINAFVFDINRVIDRYRAEFNLTLASAIGALEVIKMELYNNQKNEE